MTLDPNLLDQAYHLFVEEALELLQQIQELLMTLPQESDPIAIHKLLQTAGTIRSGAEQVNLTDIYNLARRFELVCRLLGQEKTLVDAELDHLLWQAYDCLRLSLSAQMRLDREEINALLAHAEQVFSQLEAKLARTSKSKSDLLTLNGLEDNETQWLSDKEVTRAIETLEKLLSNPQVPEFNEDLKAQIETFFRLGEIWNISAFVAIAQMSSAALQISPQTAPTIGQLALTGFRGAWEFFDKKDLDPEILILESERQTEQKSLAQSFVGEIVGESKKRSPAKNALVQVTPPLTSELTLKTAKLFIWLAGSTAFIISSEKIKEILLSQQERFVSGDREQWLYWRSQQIPIYRLCELLQYHCLYRDRPKEENSVLLVLARPQQTLALEVEIECSIAESELSILPFNSAIAPPKYCYGCILLKEDSIGAASPDRLAVAIDLEVLLSQTVDRLNKARPTPDFSTTAFVPTILVIDDSITSRQLLVLTLQKVGYRVIQARDGEEGIHKMRQNPAIDVVISDIAMPKLNGFGFLQFCRNDSHLAKVPIILLSSYTSKEHRQLAIDLGAAACLRKPFDEQEFLATLNKVIGKEGFKHKQLEVRND